MIVTFIGGPYDGYSTDDEGESPSFISMPINQQVFNVTLNEPVGPPSWTFRQAVYKLQRESARYFFQCIVPTHTDEWTEWIAETVKNYQKSKQQPGEGI